MKRIALALGLAASLGLVTLAAQRILTNAADEHLKRLFPNAKAFSTLTGTPLHYNAYGEDTKVNPRAPVIGMAFWTTDLVPQEQGYHGPIHILVGMDMTGILTGIVVDYNSEPYGYFSVEPSAFATQFAGKSIRAPFRVGADVHAVSRATISISSATRAVRDSARAMARKFLDPESVKP